MCSAYCYRIEFFGVCFLCVRSKRLPASVAAGVSGKLRLKRTAVTFHTGGYILPTRAGKMTELVLSWQAEAASFAEY